jgi:hypothetical protein
MDEADAAPNGHVGPIRAMRVERVCRPFEVAPRDTLSIETQ